LSILSHNIEKVKRQIAEVSPEPVIIVAATKTVNTDIIGSLPGLGITIAGENRAQELIAKQAELPQIDWHFIGNLQTNKVRSIIDKVSLIQSVDRLKLAEVIQREAARINKAIDVLIEVNMGAEDSKSGIEVANAVEFALAVSKLPNLRVKGLMTVLPIGAPEKIYADTRELYLQLKSAFTGIKYLSMGMSGDYLTAVKYGANMIRLGSVLFGERNYEQL